MSNNLPIFVVEDDDTIRDSIKEFFEDMGHPCELFSNGKECLVQLRAGERACLVLLDLHMPVMDGREFMKEFRGLPPEQSSIPVYLCSAGSNPEVYRELGCSGGVQKPFDLDALLAVADRHCPTQKPT